MLKLTFFGKKLPAGEEIISLNHVIVVAKNEKPPEPGAVPMVYGYKLFY
jgi:nitroimidazol reductase NimA-like FMN-containing flavoprotein (pyridoxamine 5'-phosphate oxidase superfamily)